MSTEILGARIRERRRSIGITQVELARRIGISASYLNLIERNKRGIAGALLRRTALALELRLDELDGAAERRLLETLHEIAHLPDLQALGVEAESAGELIGQYPGWGRALAALARSERQASEAARALADRLTHDPFLGETVHRMLTRIAAVRSAAEILADFTDIPTPRRARFRDIIYEESRGLSDVGEALAAYFDKVDETDRTLTPLDEVESLFDARANRFDQIEEAAAPLSELLEQRSSLRSEHANAMVAQSAGAANSTASSRRERALALAEHHLGPLLDDIIARQPQVETSPARARAREALLSYAAGAIQAPMTVFVGRAAALKYDVEALSEAFSLGIETVCHRLTALPQDQAVPRFGYFRANAAGTIIEMRGLPELVIPRYASACPLWVLYRAQQSPEAMIRQRAVFPNGARFVFLARARNTGLAGFGKPRHYLTDMLALSESDARLTVYAPDTGTPVEEVGPACRICARRACVHRVEDPMMS